MIEKYKKTRKRTIIKILILSFITTILSIELTLASYKSKINMQAATNIAVMASNVTADIENTLEGYPGCEPIVCPITLTNKDNGKICQIAQKFSISVNRKNIENLPLVFSLYKDQTCTEILEPDENGVYANDEFVFKAGIEDVQTYYLKIEWPEEEKNADLAFEIDYFELEIITEQVD